MHRDVMGYWLLAASHPFTLAYHRAWARVRSRMRSCVCACVCVMRDPKNQGGFRLIYGGARARELFIVVAPQICVKPN